MKLKFKAGLAALLSSTAFILLISVLGVWLFGVEAALESLQAEKLGELDSLEGRYSDDVIVLNDTTPQRAEYLAGRFGADLRISKDGRYASLRLPEGIGIRDIYEDDENRIFLSDMLADVRINPTDSYVGDTQVSDRMNFSFLDYGEIDSHTTGEGVTVCIIDTGLDYTHPHFDNASISEYSYNATTDTVVAGEEDMSAIYDGKYGHGTAVAGVITSIARDVELLIIKIELNSDGSMSYSDLQQGLSYAIGIEGVDVINMSWGSFGDEDYYVSLIEEAEQKGITCVAATGNDSSKDKACAPASIPYVVAVGALGKDSLKLAYYSNYYADVVAPGSYLLPAIPNAGNSFEDYDTFEGTSFASPAVAAAFALARSYYPDASHKELETMLFNTCRDIGPMEGYDYGSGYGAIQISEFILTEQVTESHSHKSATAYEVYKNGLPVIRPDAIEVHGMEYSRIPYGTNVSLPIRQVDIYGFEAEDYFGDYFNMGGGRFSYDSTVNFAIVKDKIGADNIRLEYDFEVTEAGVYEFVFLVGGGVYQSDSQNSKKELGFAYRINGGSLYQINCSREKGVATLMDGSDFVYGYSLDLIADEESRDYYQAAYYYNITAELPAGANTISIHPMVTSYYGDGFRTGENSVDFMGFYVQRPITEEEFNSYEYTEKREARDEVTTGLSFSTANGTSNGCVVGLGSSKNRRPIIPSVSPAGAVVCGIDNEGFCSSNITDITIPDTVKTVGERAFENCDYLSDVILPESAEVIGEKAFNGCAALRSVTNGKGGGSLEVGASAFASCDRLQTVSLSSESTKIAQYAFYNCVSLKSADLSLGLSELGTGAFSGCGSLREVTLADTLKVINPETFADCTSILTFNIPKSTTKICEKAFYKCTSLKELSIPSGIIAIEKMAFSDSAELKLVRLNSTLTANLFSSDSSCGGLSSLVLTILIPEGVTLPAEVTATFDIINEVNFGSERLKAYSKHTHTWQKTETEPTPCVADGFVGEVCTECGLKSGSTVDRHCRVEITDIDACQKMLVCRDCGDISSITPMHSFDEGTVKAPDCTNGGYTLYECTVCGLKEKTDYSEALGHTEGDEIKENYKAPNCTDEGTYDAVVYCTVCEKELARVKKTEAALGHLFGTEWTVDSLPTCTLAGSKSHHCVRCNEKSEITEIPAYGHTFDNWYKKASPTCTKSGVEERRCRSCYIYEQREIEPLGHKEAAAITENLRAPTCTEGGSYDTVVYCSACGVLLSRNTTTDAALGHDLKYLSDNNATYTEDGTETAVCPRCGYKDTVTVEGSALGLDAKFKDDFAAMTKDADKATRYAELTALVKLYSSLSDEEKRRVESEYTELIRHVRIFNAEARSANDALCESVEISVSPIARLWFAFMAALWLVIKKTFLI